MKPGDASLLRLYVNASDRFRGRPLFEAVVTKAQAMGLAGASVFAAELGYGHHRVVHDLMSDYAFMDSPLVVEVVESPERIQELLDEFKAMVGEGLVTVSTVSPARVVRYVHPSE